MDAVAAGTAAQGYHAVTGMNHLLNHPPGDQPYRPAIDQRVADIPLVKIKGSAGRWYAHPVAVIAHTGNHPSQHPQGMQRAGGQLIHGKIGRAEAEDIRIDDRLGAQPRTQSVPQNPSDPRPRPSIRLDSGGMVVGLHLEGDTVVIIEGHDSRVVLEDREAEGSLLLLHQLPGRSGYRVLEKIFVGNPLAIGPLMLNPGSQGLVAAMLAPGLGDGLELDVSRRPALCLKMIPDRTHLIEIERKLPIDAELDQPFIVDPRELNLPERKLVGGRGNKG